MSITFTIAVPTHNRARLLGRTLRSIAALRIPAGTSAECVVIDNNSSDDTGAVVASFGETAPMATRYVFETRIGSSRARNRAIDEAQGDFILFIDDDAIAEPDWAGAMLAEMERRRLDAACGLVLPEWAAARPRWLGPSLYARLAVHDEPELARLPRERIETIHNFFSANVGFRRETFNRFGRFREELGVIGANPMSGEDTEMSLRIIRGGGAVGFASAARVRHLIPAERMSRRYLRRKSYAFGVGSAIAGGPTHNSLDKLGRNLIRMTAALMRGDTERAVYHELECANFLGYWHGRLNLMRKRVAKP